MPDRLGPRFAVEAVFLVVLATLAALADLSWQMIVLCMGVAWLLAAIYEAARWRQGPKPPERRLGARAADRGGPAPLDGPTRVVSVDPESWS